MCIDHIYFFLCQKYKWLSGEDETSSRRRGPRGGAPGVWAGVLPRLLRMFSVPQRRHRRGPAAPAKDCADPEGRGFHPEGV